MKDMTDATFLLAAGVVERAHDLINDGWIKGRFYDDGKNPTAFCILGALELAALELVGQGLLGNKNKDAQAEVIDLAAAFICEAAGLPMRDQSSSIPGYNDASERTKEQVLGAMRMAADNLWAIAVEKEEELVDLSMYKSVEEVEPAKQYLYNVLVAA